jgi:hypothetical protein
MSLLDPHPCSDFTGDGYCKKCGRPASGPHPSHKVRLERPQGWGASKAFEVCTVCNAGGLYSSRSIFNPCPGEP